MTLSEIDSKILNDHIEEVRSTRSRPSKKQKRKQREEENSHNKQRFNLTKISPLTQNQSVAFDAWEDGLNIMLHGLAGTGKSFISLYLALNEIINHNQYKTALIVRSAVPTRDIGFLRGSVKDKQKMYELPYQTICSDLFHRGDAYDILKSKRIVDFTTTSFIRGNTFYDTIVIVDEVNNMTFHELDSVITRLGDNCRLIMCGDYRQSDLRAHEKNDLLTFIKVIDRMNYFKHVEFGIDDIVRSGIVRDYIIAKHSLGIS